MEPSTTAFQTKIPVNEKYGHVSAEVMEPANSWAVLTVGHGAGSTYNQPFLVRLCEALGQEGVCTIRYNFIYSEQRRKMPDRFPVAALPVRAVVNFAASRYPGSPIFGGGKSFGGRMTSMTQAEEPLPDLRGIVFFGFPLHPAGSPSVDRAAHLIKLSVPTLFIQGTKDDLATISLIREVVESLPMATLKEFEGADHSFKGGKLATPQAIAATASAWMKETLRD